LLFIITSFEFTTFNFHRANAVGWRRRPTGGGALPE
jgi:hypothetical protein